MKRPHLAPLILSLLALAGLGACARGPRAPAAADRSPVAAAPRPESSDSSVASAPQGDLETSELASRPSALAPASRRPSAQGTPHAARPGQRAVADSDWAQFRGPGGLGVSPDKPVPTIWSQTKNIKWKTAMPGPGASSPIVLGQRVFLTCSAGFPVPGQLAVPTVDVKRNLLCLERDTGKILWNAEVASKQPEPAVIRENHGYASSTPVADGERIYVFYGTTGVFAFDHQGKQIWQADVGGRTHGWGSAASPILYQNLVIVNASVESDSLFAFDKRTGKAVWRARGIRESWSTPLLVALPGGKTELVVPIFGKLLAFAPDTGEPLWSCDTGISWYMVPSLIANDGVIYCVGGRSGAALAIRAGGRGDVTLTHLVWTGVQGSNVCSPVFNQGHLYWTKDSPPVAYCAEVGAGRVIYEQRMDGAGQFYASPVLAGGNIYYLARGGRTYVVPARPNFELLTVNELADGGVFNATPAVAGGLLFIRSDRFLYCIGGGS